MGVITSHSWQDNERPECKNVTISPDTVTATKLIAIQWSSLRPGLAAASPSGRTCATRGKWVCPLPPKVIKLFWRATEL